MGIPKNSAYVVRFRNIDATSYAIQLLMDAGTAIFVGKDPGEFVITEYQRGILEGRKIGYKLVRISTLAKEEVAKINYPQKNQTDRSGKEIFSN